MRRASNRVELILSYYTHYLDHEKGGWILLCLSSCDICKGPIMEPNPMHITDITGGEETLKEAELVKLEKTPSEIYMDEENGNALCHRCFETRTI